MDQLRATILAGAESPLELHNLDGICINRRIPLGHVLVDEKLVQ
jgi:hypothetical protein